MKLTYHAQYERAERIAQLEETLGFTNIVFEVIHRQARVCVTSSGIAVVKKLEEEVLITAYAITIDELYALCHIAGKKQIPPKLYKKVVKNMERHSEIFFI